MGESPDSCPSHTKTPRWGGRTNPGSQKSRRRRTLLEGESFPRVIQPTARSDPRVTDDPRLRRGPHTGDPSTRDGVPTRVGTRNMCPESTPPSRSPSLETLVDPRSTGEAPGSTPDTLLLGSVDVGADERHRRRRPGRPSTTVDGRRPTRSRPDSGPIATSAPTHGPRRSSGTSMSPIRHQVPSLLVDGVRDFLETSVSRRVSYPLATLRRDYGTPRPLRSYEADGDPRGPQTPERHSPRGDHPSSRRLLSSYSQRPISTPGSERDSASRNDLSSPGYHPGPVHPTSVLRDPASPVSERPLLSRLGWDWN